jgi:hypothetical protein
MTTITVVLLITVALAVSVLIGLIVLVSIASRREDTEWTLSGPPPGPIQAITRRVLGFYAEEELASPWGRRGTRRPRRGDARVPPDKHCKSAVLNSLTRTSDARRLKFNGRNPQKAQTRWR